MAKPEGERTGSPFFGGKGNSRDRRLRIPYKYAIGKPGYRCTIRPAFSAFLRRMFHSPQIRPRRLTYCALHNTARHADNEFTPHDIGDNMKKWLTLVLLVTCAGFTACDEDSGETIDEKIEDPTAFGTLCVHSGGEFVDGACVCKGVTCSAGDVCNSESKACPEQVDPDQFKTACTESGGTPREASVSAVVNNAPHGSYASITNAPNPPNPIFPSCAVIPAVKPRAIYVPVPVRIVRQA